MYVIKFSSLKAVEYTDVHLFDQRIRKWLLHRQGENTYILEQLYRMRQLPAGQRPEERMFAVEDGNQPMAAGLLMPGGTFCLTWSTEEISEALIRCMIDRGCNLTSIYGPGAVSNRFAELWARHSGQNVDYGRSERVYQITRVTRPPSETGRLDIATVQDRDLLLRWMTNFMEEAHMEPGPQVAPEYLDQFLRDRTLFVWRNPEPVAMAAWITSAEGHHCINIVYVPPIHRGKGAASSVTSALASRILSTAPGGCFILTDTQDELTNHLYRSIGGLGVAELLRCTLHEKPAARAPELPAGRLNIVTSSNFCAS